MNSGIKFSSYAIKAALKLAILDKDQELLSVILNGDNVNFQ